MTAPPELPPKPPLPDRWLLRLMIIACQGATIWVTWHLWQARMGFDQPPNLPVVEAAAIDRLQFDCGWALLATLVLAAIWPRGGVFAHCALLAAAIGLDQMRIQPEVVSLAILLAGTLPREGLPLLARCHLISLWAFAGIHKLLSPEYIFSTGPFLARSVLGELPETPAIVLGILIACLEVATGLSAIFSSTRRATPWLALALHGGIFLSLLLQQWNSAVWPWNIALAAAGFEMFWRQRGPLLGVDSPQLKAGAAADPAQRPTRSLRGWLIPAAAMVMLFYPALYYVDRCDAYIAWCVYSSNVPNATIYQGDGSGAVPTQDQLAMGGQRLFDKAYGALNVPFPPAPRMYLQYFRKVGQPGDRLVIEDSRVWSRWRGRGKQTFVMTDRREVVEENAISKVEGN